MTYPSLDASEFILKGDWVREGLDIVADETACRIGYLTRNILVKVAVDFSGWATLYRDATDGRYWELTYPDSYEHGGGAPMLACLEIEEIKLRYVID